MIATMEFGLPLSRNWFTLRTGLNIQGKRTSICISLASAESLLRGVSPFSKLKIISVI